MECGRSEHGAWCLPLTLRMTNEDGVRHAMKARERVNGFDWSLVDDVLLDMDGTLLDRHFDNYFFEHALPRRYAETVGLDFEQARHRLMAMCRAVEGRLEWADLAYWTSALGVDVLALSNELAHLIGFLPDAVEFLEGLRRRGKRLSLVTNAHPGGIAIKTARTGLDRHVDRIVGAFDVGYLKMHPRFWPECRRALAFDPGRSLYLDDDEACLLAAEQFGIRHIFHSAKSSSRSPAEPSTRFPAITSLRQLAG